MHVSIHAPARGATGAEKSTGRAGVGFQSTRPRGARPGRRYLAKPAKRLFQSTRPRGARPRRQPANFRADSPFQSTRPRGARPVLAHVSPFTSKVSIHAPARGATVLKSGGCFHFFQFQSTRPRGARPQNAYLLAVYAIAFQSTRPRGARPQARFQYRRANHVSIHAPARGATIATDELERVLNVSIHAPARGAT